jgi:2-polyprenyl-3-methyl-5-hydroxy-6-metoxy-1,4-benzoquinol methylase
LGKLSYTGKFPKNNKINIKKTDITLVICTNCSLVQLHHIYNMQYLYNQDYGYRTGINKTMTTHMKQIQKILCTKTKIRPGDSVLDIASNDGTLLNFYNKNIVKVGIDPLIARYKKFYKNIEYKIPDFFSYNLIQKYKIQKKFKIITALSVFYDIEDPNKFLRDLNSVLDNNGIFLLEYADLFSIIKNKMFDTICQEHITYYSTKVILQILNKNNLRIFDIKRNSINGGSIQYFICKKNAKFKTNIKSLNRIIKEESMLKLDNVNTYKNFFRSILKIKNQLVHYLDNLLENNKTIHGYGASTKGNVLLQFFGINKKYLTYIAERNPNKYNLFTPGTKIKIISENNSRLMNPDYYLVLPWHFKKEILYREKKIIKEGTKFIFPLPDLKTY